MIRGVICAGSTVGETAEEGAEALSQCRGDNAAGNGSESG